MTEENSTVCFADSNITQGGIHPRSLEKALNINNHTNELLYHDSPVVKLQFKTHKHHFVSKILSTKEMYKNQNPVRLC